MNEQRSPEKDDAELAELLERSGPRPEVAPADLAAIQDAFRDEWRRHVARQRRATVSRRWLTAAALVAGLGGAWWWNRGTPPLPPAERVARVVAVHGAPTSAGARLSPGLELRAGALVETGPAGDRLALRTEEGLALRLDAGTRLRLDGARAVTLERGALYLDSGAGRLSIAVTTALGVVRDVGTRFEVRLLEDDPPALRVRVRDGAIELAAAGGTASAKAGEELTLARNGRLERRAAAPHGPDWDWVIEAGPPFELEGRSLAEFLAWVELETGWRVAYDDPSLETTAATITLHGSLGELNAAAAPDVVLPGARLDHRLEAGVLHLSRAR